MGTNKRYARYYDKQMDERSCSGTSLLPAPSGHELQLDVVPVTVTRNHRS